MRRSPIPKAVVDRLQVAGERFDVLSELPAWVETIEGKYGRRLPDAYRSLLTGFAFSEFDIGGITMFSNLNDGSPMDITVAPFADEFMSAWLLGRNYVQFGRRGSYDPVCFDVTKDRKEPPVVVLDHEDILLERKKIRIQKLANSFLDLVERR